MRRAIVLLGSFALLHSFGASSAGKTLTVEDILSMRTPQTPMISPDGLQVVYVVNEPLDEEHSKDPANTDLWLVSTHGGNPRRLTSNPDRDSSPQWSPNGT